MTVRHLSELIIINFTHLLTHMELHTRIVHASTGSLSSSKGTVRPWDTVTSKENVAVLHAFMQISFIYLFSFKNLTIDIRLSRRNEWLISVYKNSEDNPNVPIERRFLSQQRCAILNKNKII